MSIARALPLRRILARVSRSFYVSLWLLPRETRETVALAYLLARAADTIADTRLVPPAQRIVHLDALAGVIAGRRGLAPLDRELAALAARDDVIPEERALLQELPGCVALLDALPSLERELVRRVLATITRGMVLDLERFPGEDASALASLATRDELFDYCWHVAGCVGEFWSELHAARLPSLRRIDVAAWSVHGRAFGRALQLVNVLRDVPRDLAHGRCYLPRQDLDAVGLAPRDLLRPDAWPRLAPRYRALVDEALAAAEGGLRHTLAIPAREPMLRLAGLVPLLLGVETLGVVLAGNPLDTAAPRKVGRGDVRRVIAQGALAIRHDRELVALWRRTLRRAGFSPA